MNKLENKNRQNRVPLSPLKKWLTDTCKPLFLFNIPKNIPFEFRSQADFCGYEWICP